MKWEKLADDYWEEVRRLLDVHNKKETELNIKELRSRYENIKGGHKYLYLHSPPDQTAEALMEWQTPKDNPFYSLLEDVSKKTPEEMKQSLISAGIIDENGKLMPQYQQPERKPRERKPTKTQERKELLNEVSSLLEDYADFIRDNYDTELTERLNKAIVKISEWQEVLSKGEHRDA